MPGHGLTARAHGALLAAAFSSLVLTLRAAASSTDPVTEDPPWTHAAAWGANQPLGARTARGSPFPAASTGTVEVRVVHPRRGDLAVDLIDPNGRGIRLKNGNPTDTRPDVNARFQVQVDQDLGRLDDSRWRLRIEDTATGTVGHLNSWPLPVSAECSHPLPPLREPSPFDRPLGHRHHGGLFMSVRVAS